MMEELDKGLAIAAPQSVQDEFLPRFEAQIGDWDLALPKIQPLVLDFGLGNFAETGLIEYWIANEVAAGYCAKYLFVFDGQCCPVHRHAHKHETFFVVRGAFDVTYGDALHHLRPGDTLPIAPGHYHGFRGLGPSLLLEVSQPCVVEDNEFLNPAIPIGRGRQ